MASTFPGASPLQNALSSLGALPDSQRAVLAQNAFDSIARETSVPANVLIALDEATGGGGDAGKAQQSASAIADLVRNGKSIEDAVTTLTGDAARGRAVLDRAYDLADALYPAPASQAAPEKSTGGFVTTAKDVGKTLAGAAMSGVGMGVEAASVLGDEAARVLKKSNEIRAGRDPGEVQGTTPIRDFGRWLGGDVIGGAGQAISDSASPEFKEKMAKSAFKGDITSPSTWQLPEDPSVAGTIGVGAQVAGTLIPVLLSGSARGAALIGGLMGGGEGVQNGRKFVEDAAKTVDENGRPAIEKLPGYQDLIGRGATPAQATAELTRRAETDAGFREGLISSVGGAITNRIFHTAEGWLGTGGRLARAAKKAGASFTEEGSQEVAENAASQSGINAATGSNTNVFDDSLQNFIAGGMGGGMAGAAGGFAGPSEPRVAPTPPTQAPLGALPPPPLALPAPTGPGYRPNFTMVDPRTNYVPNFTMRDAEPERTPAGPGLPGPEQRLALPAPTTSSNTGAVGSDAGAVAAPGQPDLSAGQPGAVAMTPPTGPVDAIAKTMAQASPPPAAEPTLRFPEQRPGNAVRLGDPDTGEIVDGVFLRETPNGALVRIKGRELELSPEQFDALRDIAPAIDEANKRAVEAAKQAEKDAKRNVEQSRPDQSSAPVDRSVSNPLPADRQGSSEGAAPSGTVVTTGEARVPAMDESGLPAAPQDQASRGGDTGGLAVADGSGQLAAGVTTEQQAMMRAQDLRREASRIRKEAKTPSTRSKEERRADLQRADAMVREAAAIEDNLKAPAASVPSPKRAEWLRKRLAFLDQQAKASGWDARLLAQRQEARRELDAVTNTVIGADENATSKNAATPKSFWAYQADEPPTVPPPGVNIRPEDWDTLSPGMRREIARDVARRPAQKAPKIASEISSNNDRATEIEQAANEAATSPQNDLPEPTQAQKEAGNYKVGRVRIGGMDISIENPKGSERKGVDSDGEPWSVTMPAHYGYVRRTEGADGDHVDVYVGDHPESDKAFVVDQMDAKTGKFDEHKAILGTNTLDEATALYDAGFSDGKGPQRRGAVTEMTVPAFKDWAENGDTKAPIGDIKAANVDTEGQNADTKAPKADKAPTRVKLEDDKLQPVPITNSPAFRMWFGESKVVDAEGNPLVVYHGGPAKIIDQFRPERIGSSNDTGFYGRGYYFTASRELAEAYRPDNARIGKAAGGVQAVYLSIKNPFIWDLSTPELQADTIARAKNIFAEGEVTTSGMHWAEPDTGRVNQAEGRAKWTKALKAAGYDGVFVEVKGLHPEDGPHEIVAFEPTQIKAVNNRGTFDPNDPRVREQRVPITNSPVVANISGNELGAWSDIRQLGRKAAAWYRRTFLGDKPKTVINADTGWSIEFNKAGVNKIGGRKGEDIYKAVVALPQILQQGVLVNSEADKRGRPDIKAIHKIVATVKIDGRDVPLVATVRETADGKFHYDLSRESEGGRTESAEPLGKTRLGQPALEGASSDINIDRADEAANPAQSDNSGKDAFPDIGSMTSGERHRWATSGNIKVINAAMREALDRVGISSRVTAFQHHRMSQTAYGQYSGGWITIFRQGNSWRRTLDHEIVHAMRDPRLWGEEYGLFTANEWRALVKAGRRNDEIRTWAERQYPNLDTANKSEEMVAELYSLWAAGKYASPPPGPLARALERITQFLRAVASGLRGEGFVDPAAIMERIADGSIGRRQQSVKEQEFSPEMVEMAKAYLVKREVSADPEEEFGYTNGDDYVRLAEVHGFQLSSAELSLMPKQMRVGPDFSAVLQSGKGRALGMIGNFDWAKTGKVFEHWLTDAMGKRDSVNVLSLVPGYSLFSELGKNLPGAQRYLRFKQQMDADRNELQAKAADIVDKWVGAARRDTKANDALMDLMHESTLAGIDPTNPDGWRRIDDIGATEVGPRASKAERDRAAQVAADIAARKKTWDSLKARYDALPKRFQEMYGQIRDEYGRMSDLTDAALMENIRTAASIAVKQAKRAHKAELKRIEDEGLKGQERADAIGKANERLSQAMARNAESKMSKINSLRQMFESNKLLGPYFPLARFGSYFATVRDGDGKVVSFSRFETKAQQEAFIRRAEAEKLGKVEHGVLGGGANLKGMVDPRFVSEIEVLLQDAGANVGLQDAIWQRWLETLPDQSMRKARIHRKGRFGFDRDAIRAFSSAMFHGAHQLARLRYGLEMGEALNEAEEQAADAADPERAGFVVREMRKRHEFTMSPTNNPLVTASSNLAFLWYLGASPATALVNVSQTTIVGVPVLAARFKKLGVGAAVKQLGRALRDFGTGRGSVVKRVNGVPVWTDTWSVENSPRLSADEKAAMAEGYNRGVIDKTQSHDLASVAETGVEYNPTRERVMRAISFMFHHTERLNREITYLAAYRMARAEGLTHQEAIDEASGLTWKTHFSYQNTDRPRIMQSDVGKILTTFRNFTANMLFRLFRDMHQTFTGATKAERAEARAQLIGITLSLFAHAGIRGVWGYGMLMTLLGLFLPGGADDQDEWLQDTLLMNGDSTSVAAWNWLMGMVLNGVPGTALGVDLTNRIGMPDLWFRTPDKDLEGKDLWSFYTEQILGPVAAIGGGTLSGISMVADGQVLRGLEKIVPNAASDMLKATRYVKDGVTTYYGDPIVDYTNPWEVLMTAAGFTPGRIAERYEINNRLKRREKEITDERKDIHREIGDAIRAGQAVPDGALQRMRDFNKAYPEYPITPKSIKQSVRSREQSSARNEFGVSLNPKLNARLREERAPTVYPSNKSSPARAMAEQDASE